MAGDNKAENSKDTGDANEAMSSGEGRLPDDIRNAKDTRSMVDNSTSTVYDKMIKFLDEMDEEKFREKVSQAMVEVDRQKLVKKRKWITLAGLLLSIAGTVLIWVDSQAVIKELSDVLIQIIEPAGIVNDVFVEPNEIDEFHQRMESASNLDKKGFVLLILGFLMQVVGVVVKDRESVKIY